MRQYAYQKLTCTAYGRQRETGNTMQAFVLALKGALDASVKFKAMYGPRDRLPLCRDAAGSAQVVPTGCLADAWKLWLLALVYCLLTRCLLNEGSREPSSRQTITPGRYDERTLATNHNAATGKRGYHTKNIVIIYTQ